MKVFVAFRSKTYSCLVYNDDDVVDDSKYKKAKKTKKCVIKRGLKFND